MVGAQRRGHASPSLAHCTPRRCRFPTGLDGLGLPTNSTSVFTLYFQVPFLPGSYSCHVTADSYMWDEYNEYNNDVTVNYQVDVPRLPTPGIPA
jgi:hypothetical protein